MTYELQGKEGGAQQNRRREDRRPYGREIHWGAEQLEAAQGVDLSAGGIAILVDSPADLGTEVAVAFLDRSVAVRGVVRSHQSTDEGVRVGVQFFGDEREVVEVVLAVT